MSSEVFEVTIPVRFQHTDPAGIVFYPRYFEMVNQVVEDWFAERLGASFAEVHSERRLGTPTVHVDCNFSAPARLGDVLRFSLFATRIGRSSFSLEIDARNNGTPCFTAAVTLVFITLASGRPIDIPEEIRGRMQGYLQEDRS